MAERVLSSQLHRLYRRDSSRRFRGPSGRQLFLRGSSGNRFSSVDRVLSCPVSRLSTLLRLFSGVHTDTWPRNFPLLLLRYAALFCRWPDFYKLKECVCSRFCCFCCRCLRISIFTVDSAFSPNFSPQNARRLTR